jgi:hypothetical protein
LFPQGVQFSQDPLPPDEEQMLSKCSNPDCPTLFRYLHEGKLFRIELDIAKEDGATFGSDPELKKPVRRTEFFWLCSECSVEMTLDFQKGVGIKTRPLRRPHAVAS